jgi:hypothetical protein
MNARITLNKIKMLSKITLEMKKTEKERSRMEVKYIFSEISSEEFQEIHLVSMRCFTILANARKSILKQF